MGHPVSQLQNKARREKKSLLYFYVKVPRVACCLLREVNCQWLIASNFCSRNLRAKLSYVLVRWIGSIVLSRYFQFFLSIANSLVPLFQFVTAVCFHALVVFWCKAGILTVSFFIAERTRNITIALFLTLCLCQSKLEDGIIFSTCPFVCYQSCEWDILKMNKPILIQIGTKYVLMESCMQLPISSPL